MTPEELDSFEKVAARWERYGSPADTAKAADLAMPLIEALREALAEMDEFALAVGYGERPEGQSGVHRLHGEQLADCWKRIERERDDARAELEHAFAEGGALYDAKVAQSEAEQERDEAIAMRDEARAEVARRTDWYQQRFNALRAWVKREVEPFSTAVATGYWNIVANGSPSPHESADWTGTMHAANLRADIAEGKMREAQNERDAARAEIGRLRVENKFLRERPIPEGRIHQAMTVYVMDLRGLVLDHEWVTDGRECFVYCLWCKQSESNGHAEACEMFGPGGLIPIDPKTRRPAPVKSLRERGCQCQWEAGDSACPVHGEEAK